jgi:hypothetical protein
MGYVITPELRELDPEEGYIILIDGFKAANRVSKLFGYPGKFGHTEFIFNERAYGNRPVGRRLFRRTPWEKGEDINQSHFQSWNPFIVGVNSG